MALPYRPKNKPWPHDRCGVPLTFLAQFCFADSTDHVGDLPGSVLLVFIRRVQLLDGGVSDYCDPYLDDDSLQFEWYSLGLTELITIDQLPHITFEFPTCFGVRFRGLDYAETDRNLQQLMGVVPAEFLGTHEFDNAIHSARSCIIHK